MRCVLGGFMATGKSTIGKKLANSLGWSFFDLDDLVNRQCLDRHSATIADLIASGQEETFRQIEYRIAKTFLTEHPSNVVLALGGGTLHNRDLGEWIEQNCRLLVFHAKWETVSQRIQLSNRPLRNNAQQLFSMRKEGYQRGFPIEVDEMSVDEVVVRCQHLLKGKGVL